MLSGCENSEVPIGVANHEGYVGDAACIACHKTEY